MAFEILREGGPHNIRRTGKDKYALSIELPKDEAGMTARACPDVKCSPGAFKVKSGTGMTGDQSEAFCPYCRCTADPEDFTTKDQERYAHDVFEKEAVNGVRRFFIENMGLGPTGTKKYDNGLISMTLTMEVEDPRPIRSPLEEQLRRHVTCPHCTLEHAVYGIAVWCPDCGKDIFITHVESEAEVVRAMLNEVGRRRSELGSRVAARDVENALEDVVSILEGAMKAMTRRKLLSVGRAPNEVELIMKKDVATKFQGYRGLVEVLNHLFGFDLGSAIQPAAADQFTRTLEKRHPITHNLGIADRKYLEKVQTGEPAGRDVNLDELEVIEAIDTALSLMRSAHAGLFPL